MKTFTTVLLTSSVIGLGTLQAAPSLAASFSFEYVFESGAVLSGMVDGDRVDGDANPDPNGFAVINLSNWMAEIDGVPVPTTFAEAAGSFPFPAITFDGTIINFSLRAGPDPSPIESQGVFFDVVEGSGQVGYALLNVDPPIAFESYDPSRWTLTAKPIPEPLTILGSGAALAFGASFKRQLSKKKSSNKA